MKALHRLTVGTRMFVSFTVLLVFMAAVGLVGYYVSRSVGGYLATIFHVRMPGLNYLVQADRDLQQLLVAERSLTFTKPGSDKYKALLKEYNENLGQAEKRVGKYAALADTDKEKQLLTGYGKARQDWLQVSRQVLEASALGTPESRQKAQELTMGEASTRFEKMRDFLDKLQDLILERAGNEADSSDTTYARGMWVLLIVGGGGVLLGLLIAFTVGRDISMNLRKVISGMAEAADQVTSSSSEVDSSSQSLAQGSSEQAASLEETASSMEEMSSMTKQNAENAQQANSLMDEAQAIVAKASESMAELKEAIAKIDAASDETAKIIKTIDEIAFQTNLLALNAAVEAARAGEAGAGFAVVADEVRSLAMRAAEAATNTSGLIERNISDIKRGAGLVQSTDQVFGEVRQAAGKVSELVAEIAAASSEQANGIDQVNTAMNEMSKVTQRNAAGAEEGAAAASELTVQAERMRSYLASLERLAGGAGRQKRAGGLGRDSMPDQPRLLEQ
jgi:methyl-accepting chemotaxis protein